MKKLSLFLLALFTMTMALPSAIAQSPAPSAQPFPDVESERNFSEAIEYLKTNNIIEGYPDGTYKPESDINRAEFTKIIVGALTDNPTGSNCFPDVKTEWFAKYVCEAKTRGIVAGHPDGTFKPSENINFSEASKIIAEAFDIDIQATGQTNSTYWFEKYVDGLSQVKAIPMSVEYFDEKIHRDEMAEMVWRIKVDETEKSTRSFPEIVGSQPVRGLSCEALVDRYQYSIEDGRYGGGVIMLDSQEAGADTPTSAPARDLDEAKTTSTEGEETMAQSNSGAAADDYSTTNIQVAGVDEADIIKNDGQYIYLIKGSTIRIIKAYPANEMEEVIKFGLGETDENFYPTEMYVEGDKLIVIGSANVYYTMPFAAESKVAIYPPFNQDRTRVYIVDIKDRKNPSVTRTVDFEAGHMSSRRVGNTLYMVLNRWNFYPYYYEKDTAQDFTADAFLPIMEDSAVGRPEKIAPCSDIYVLPKTRDFNFIIAAAIPLDSNERVSRSTVVGNADNVYASPENMYITSYDYGQFYDNAHGPNTGIYRFSLDGSNINFEAKGNAPGSVLNQFSMDEHENYFRVATTRETYFPNRKTDNNLYVFDQSMNRVGSVEGIAPGETIKSARFMGDRAFIVTFRQVDPLFALDVSDPRNPKIEGQLKIPGYSEYLHPYDENHLLGFGREVDINVGEELEDEDFVRWEQMQGMKLSLFDVTDIQNPKEMFTESIGDRGTTSDLLYNHKALLFDREKQLLAFPVQVTEYLADKMCTDHSFSTCPTSCLKICVPTCTVRNGIRTCSTSCNGADSCVDPTPGRAENTFSGAYVYSVNLQNGFTLKGKITHLNEDDQLDMTETNYWDWQKNIQRIMYMGQNLYTVSLGVVKANSLSTLEELNEIELAPDENTYYYDERPMPL